MRFAFWILSIIFFIFTLSYTASSALYTVRSGDSLIKISKRLGARPAEIKKLNPKVKWMKIRPGDKQAAPIIYRYKNTENNVYIVKQGDSLIKISKTLSINPKSIKRSNPNVHWLRIRPNDKIIIPHRLSSTALSKVIIHRNNVYTVRKNSTLNDTADKMDISINEIKKLNPDVDWIKIKPNNNSVHLPHKTYQRNKKNTITAKNTKRTSHKKKSFRPGEIGDGYYIIAKGDTLSSIAHRFGLSLKYLMVLNTHMGRYIKPGELVVLPGKLTKKIMLSQKENLYIPPKYLVYSTPYRIKKGDSLWKIANKFGTKVYVLKMLNNLGNGGLRWGRVIFVPDKNMIHKNRLELEYSLLREKRNALISYAERFLGHPYRFGGDSLLHGIDCSAFIQRIYGKFHIKTPRTAQAQYNRLGVFIPLSRIRIGDLLFFHTMSYSKVTHVGIYIGRNRFIHAAGRRSGIKISTLNRYYRRRLIGAKRIFSVNNKYVYFRNRSG